MCYPLVNVDITMENHHVKWENSLFLWHPMAIINSFLSVYQRSNIIRKNFHCWTRFPAFQNGHLFTTADWFPVTSHLKGNHYRTWRYMDLSENVDKWGISWYKKPKWSSPSTSFGRMKIMIKHLKLTISLIFHWMIVGLPYSWSIEENEYQWLIHWMNLG